MFISISILLLDNKLSLEFLEEWLHGVDRGLNDELAGEPVIQSDLHAHRQRDLLALDLAHDGKIVLQSGFLQRFQLVQLLEKPFHSLLVLGGSERFATVRVAKGGSVAAGDGLELPQPKPTRIVGNRIR